MRKLYFSTDIKHEEKTILGLYKSKFQIEFLYRDAKQFAGLNDREVRSENKLDFHFNTSLTTINLAKISHWLSEPKEKRGPFSMSDIKTVYHNDLHIDLFIYLQVRNKPEQNTKKNKHRIRQLSCFGKIVA